MARRKITTTDRATLVYLVDHKWKNGYAPTLRDLGAYFGITTNAARCRIAQLERKGYIRRKPGKARAITVIAGPAPRFVPVADTPRAVPCSQCGATTPQTSQPGKPNSGRPALT